MSRAIAMHNNEDSTFESLLDLPKRCADNIRPYVVAADLDSYKNFLNMMYHYTLGSEEKCLFAAEKTNSKELREYFLHMAKEERGHYLLAAKDLEGFGEKVDAAETPEVVKEFETFWYSLGKKDPNEFAGALLVFEGIADHLNKEVIDLILRLQLNKQQSRWLRVHAEADHAHGEEARLICEKCYSQNPEAMTAAATKAVECWSNVFRIAFENSAFA